MFSEAWNPFCRRDGTRSPVLNLANFSCDELGNASAVGDRDNDTPPKRGDKIPSLTPSTPNCVEEEIVTSTAVGGGDDDFDFFEDDEEMVASTAAVNGDEILQSSTSSLPDDFDFLPTFKELVDIASNNPESTTLNEFLKSKDSWTSVAAPHTYSIGQEIVDIENILSATQSERQGSPCVTKMVEDCYDLSEGLVLEICLLLFFWNGRAGGSVG